MQETLKAVQTALFLENNPTMALELAAPLLAERSKLSFSEERTLVEIAGLSEEFLQHYDEASRYFISISDYYQSGYCQMLKGSLHSALEFWKPLVMMRQNHWCITLYGLITNQVRSLPTFLQIRNHLEADIFHLIHANQMGMVNNMLQHVDFLAHTNLEAYKFVGRALLHAGQLDRCVEYLLRGQKTLPNDPEVYFHLGQYYFLVRQFEEASLLLNQCLLITASYTPARDLLDKIHAESESA